MDRSRMSRRPTSWGQERHAPSSPAGRRDYDHYSNYKNSGDNHYSSANTTPDTDLYVDDDDRDYTHKTRGPSPKRSQGRRSKEDEDFDGDEYRSGRGYERISNERRDVRGSNSPGRHLPGEHHARNNPPRWYSSNDGSRSKDDNRSYRQSPSYDRRNDTRDPRRNADDYEKDYRRDADRSYDEGHHSESNRIAGGHRERTRSSSDYENSNQYNLSASRTKSSHPARGKYNSNGTRGYEYDDYRTGRQHRRGQYDGEHSRGRGSSPGTEPAGKSYQDHGWDSGRYQDRPSHNVNKVNSRPCDRPSTTGSHAAVSLKRSHPSQSHLEGSSKKPRYSMPSNGKPTSPNVQASPPRPQPKYSALYNSTNKSNQTHFVSSTQSNHLIHSRSSESNTQFDNGTTTEQLRVAPTRGSSPVHPPVHPRVPPRPPSQELQLSAVRQDVGGQLRTPSPGYMSASPSRISPPKRVPPSKRPATPMGYGYVTANTPSPRGSGPDPGPVGEDIGTLALAPADVADVKKLGRQVAFYGSTVEQVAYRILYDVLLHPFIGMSAQSLDDLSASLSNVQIVENKDGEIDCSIADLPPPMLKTLSHATAGTSDSWRGGENTALSSALVAKHLETVGDEGGAGVVKDGVRRYVELVELWFENNGWFGNGNHVPHGAQIERLLDKYQKQAWGYQVGGGMGGGGTVTSEETKLDSVKGG